MRPDVCVWCVLVAMAWPAGAPAMGSEGFPPAAPMREIEADWLLQDAGADAERCFRGPGSEALDLRTITKVLAELGQKEAAPLRAMLTRIPQGGVDDETAARRYVHVRACTARRARRLAPLLARCRRIVFAKHHVFPSSNVFYTEALSDAQSQRNFKPGSAKSKLPAMLAEGHNKVRLSVRERELLACWIDLLVPFCGDYREANAWSDAENRKYDHFEAKRLRMRAREEENVRGLWGPDPAGARVGGRAGR